MILTQNVDSSEIFEEKRFVSRSSSTVKFTVQSMHTDAGQHFLPGFKSVQIYDETCDRGNYHTPRQCGLWQVFLYKFIFGAMIFY